MAAEGRDGSTRWQALGMRAALADAVVDTAGRRGGGSSRRPERQCRECSLFMHYKVVAVLLYIGVIFTINKLLHVDVSVNQ